MSRFISVLALLCVLAAAPALAQLDRSIKPGPGPAPTSSFPQYTKQVTTNGIRVIVVPNHEVPTIDLQIVLDFDATLEGDLAGYSQLAGTLLRSGTTTRTKDQLDKEIDGIGGTVNSSMGGLYASGLSRYTDQLMALAADVVLHPTFPADELDRLRQEAISGLKYRKTDPEQIVEVVRQVVLYGTNHPYGEQTSEETYKRITRDDCVKFYNEYFKPGSAIIAVVGDIEADRAVALVEKYFGAWPAGQIVKPTFPAPAALQHTSVALVDRPGAPQSVIRVSKTVSMKHGEPGVIPAAVMNTILGGGASFRLFTNLREKHSYTYGAYSGLGPDEVIASFTVRTSAKSAMTDSALKEIFNEINRIRSEKVGDTELMQAKNYMSGSFVRGLESGRRVAGLATDLERYHLPATYYENYLQAIDKVTADDVQKAAGTYLDPAGMLVAVVGPAKEIETALAGYGPVTRYDEDGKVMPAVSALPAMSAQDIIAKYMEKTGGRKKWAAIKDRTVKMTGKVQNFDMNITVVHKAPKKMYMESEIPGMFKQVIVSDGKKASMSGPQGSSEIPAGRFDLGAISFYLDYGAMGFKAEVTGTKAIKGNECYEVTFTRGDDVKRDYFSGNDFLKVRESRPTPTPQGTVDQVTDISDYREMKGYLIPMAMEQSMMGQMISLKVTSVEINTGVKDSRFALPAAKK
jgi:zinc protease